MSYEDWVIAEKQIKLQQSHHELVMALEAALAHIEQYEFQSPTKDYDHVTKLARAALANAARV